MLRCCVLLLAVAPALAAEAPGPEMQSLVAAERAFARASVEHGTREAFLEFLADDAVIFRPGPVAGREWLEERPAAKGRLSWEPLFADLSGEGDFGYTTGPWQFLPPDGEPSHGHYVTVWRREPGGRWRVAADIGIGHPRPETLAGDLTFAKRRRSRPANVRAASSAPRGREALETADRAYAALAAEQSAERACREHAADSLRLYREGTAPLVGKRVACRALAERGERSVSTPAGAVIADSRDLGFVYGTLELAPGVEGSSPRPGSFLRIWEENVDGTWKIVLDVAVPHPAPSEGS